jgi:hypothetical protein
MIENMRIPTPKFSAIALSVLLLGSIATAQAADIKLSGAEEVPAVHTSALGQGEINVAPDKSLSGSVSTTGVNGTAAHIHIGAAGKSGPVAIPLVKTAENVWSVAPGIKLTDEQYRSYVAGDLYVNVHSAAHKDGEIRGQIKP